MSRHLFAPLIDKVGVVQWARFNVRSFGGCLYLILFERFADQCGCGFLDFDWRRCDAAENDACVIYTTMIGMDPRCDAQHWKIKCAATPKFLIRSAPAVCRRELNVHEEFVGTLVQVVDTVVVVQSGRIDYAFAEC